MRAIRERVTVGANGRVQIDRTDLPEGRTAEVIVLLEESASATPASGRAVAEPRPLISFLGACRGQFGSSEEADAFLRDLRDERDQP